MKKLLQNSSVLLLAICLLVINNNLNAQSLGGINLGNLGPYNLDSLNKLKDNFTDFQSLTDSLTNVVGNQLADTNLVDPKMVDSLNNQIANVQASQDSIIKLISDSTKISKDSLISLQNQYSYLQDKQDSLSQELNNKIDFNKDSLLNVYYKLQLVQSETDSLQQVFLKNLANIQTFNQDSLNKAMSQLNDLQQQVSEAVNNPTSIDDISIVSFSLFPNPTQESFSVSSLLKIVELKIYNLSGSLVKAFKEQSSYNVANLSSGLYHVYIQFSKETKIIKLQIQ